MAPQSADASERSSFLRVIGSPGTIISHKIPFAHREFSSPTPQQPTANSKITSFFTTAANAAAPGVDRAEVMAEVVAVLATVDELVTRTARLPRTAVDLQQRIPPLLQRLTAEPEPAAEPEPEAAEENSLWIPDTPKTPAQVAAEHANLADGSRPIWVVYIGREPGIYTTVEGADMQVKGCPDQQYRHKASKQEALAFYEAQYKAGLVRKLVEVIRD
ncbi:hypothetical protein C8R45DRAFT_1098858 [Mycena sanguinolenta]|nr:hypothetical protein C8R45DRAFT_1098858 [Mycena sanguinolenta]